MSNLVVFPLLIPMLSGLVLAIFRKYILFQRWFSLISFTLLGIVSFYLVQQVSIAGIQVLELGGWKAPFGIVLVADMFSAILLLTTSFVGGVCILYAFKSIGVKREQYYFYPLVHFLIAGVNGSFLTGDLFNLFVCFEVMLLSSYVLLSLGSTGIQLQETIKYAVINSISSTLFLLAIAYLYATIGTLNMAHIAVRVAEAGQTGFITTVAILFIVVFSLKAALFLFFWLPGSYNAPPTVIAALFGALLTKVGIYALFRMFTLIFCHQPELTHALLGVMSIFTLILGGLGAIAYWDIRNIVAYNVIISVGFIVSGLAVFTSNALIGSIYYIVHDMLMKAVLFLLAGIVIRIAGTNKLKEMSGLIRSNPLLGWLFFLTAFSLAGIPPLSGFVGKALIVKEGLAMGATSAGYYWLAAIGLLSSLMVLYSLMKVFINGFWGESYSRQDLEKANIGGLLLPCVLLTAAGVIWGVGAELFYPYVEQAANGMMNPNYYIKAVLHGVV